MKYEKTYFVYILASQKNGTLYIGMTSDLLSRNFQHRNKLNPDSFTAKYNVDKLMFYEAYADVYDAITREKQLKAWKRQWKIDLIEKDNPSWKDLFKDITSGS